MARSLGALVDEFMLALRCDCVEAYQMAEELACTLRCNLQVGDEEATIRFDGLVNEPSGSERGDVVTVVCQKQTVHQLVGGAISVTLALESGRFELMGSPEAIERAAQVAQILLRGALRSPGCQDILREWEAQAVR